MSGGEMVTDRHNSKPVGEKGQGLVEFALVALFLLLVMFAIIDFARVFFGYATMANAVQAMKLGAADYLAKPFTDDELISTIETACLKKQQGKSI